MPILAIAKITIMTGPYGCSSGEVLELGVGVGVGVVSVRVPVVKFHVIVSSMTGIEPCSSCLVEVVAPS